MMATISSSLDVIVADKDPRQVPSLSTLCLQAVCSKIERYPPQAFAVLSQDEWERIIQYRHRATAPNNKKKLPSTTAAVISVTTNGGGLDGTGRMIPALNAQMLRLIEEYNPHLATSEVSDTLIWKDCVEHAFSSNSEYLRPKALRMPWSNLVKSLRDAGQELLNCWTECSANGANLDSCQVEVEQALLTLHEAPMTVDLLTGTGIGKVASKLVKNMSKSKRQVQEDKKVDGHTSLHEGINWFVCDEYHRKSAGTPSTGAPKCELSSCPLTQLEQLLQAWKELASASGVKMTSILQSPSKSIDCITGQGRRTSEEQYRKDLLALQSCNSWRDLYAVLESRREAIKSEMGANLRKTREHLISDRLKTKACRTVSEKREAILNGSRGTRSIAAAAAKSATSTGQASLRKIAVLKEESRIAAARQKSGVQKSPIKNVSIIGCSIANAQGKKKRALDMQRNDVALGGGKKMKLPQSGALNAAKKGMSTQHHSSSISKSRGGFMKR